jgi:3-phenylpropionate/cinnamic acid dioxygenase small subunit
MDDAFYERLVADFRGWPGSAVPEQNASLREECIALLNREARLLDERRFDEWLGLFTEDCLVWLPATAPFGDPRAEVAVVFDDRRRLEDRIFRLGTGSAWSQVPPSRTARLVSNIEVFPSLMVRSTFLMSEFRAGETRLWSGWCAHRLKRTAQGLRIDLKQVNLLNCDQNLANPSVLF